MTTLIMFRGIHRWLCRFPMFEDNGLSERELEILKLVATGASNKEIAAQLVISPNTVKVHLRNIFAKIDVVSRTEATLYAIRIGVIKPDAADQGNFVEYPAENAAVESLPGPEPRQWRRPVIIGALIVIIGIVVFLSIRPALFPETPAAVPVTIPESRWIEFPEMPETNSGMAGTAYEGIVYLIGGQNNGTVSNMVMAYDANNDRWMNKAAKPTAVMAAGAAVLGEKIYVPGGLTDQNTATDVLEIYNPRTDQWEQGPSMPATLGGYALASYEGKLFIFGGWDGTNYSSKVYTYDPAQATWAERSEMKIPRAFCSAAVLGSKIFLVGGKNERGTLGDTQVYYPDRLDQGETAWEKRSNIPEKRAGGSMVSLAGGLYLAGGVDSAGKDSLPLIKYDEINDAWDKLEAPLAPLGDQLSVLAVDTRIHVFGGQVEGQNQTLHTAYQAIYTVLIPAITR